MRYLTLNKSLFFAVLIALLPIGFISVTQGHINRKHAQTLFEESLTTAALATAALEREPFAMAERRLDMLAKDQDVVNATLECSSQLERALGSQDMVINLIRSDASGRVQCSVLPVKGSASFSDEEWWEIASKTRQFSISKPTVGTVSGEQIFVAVHPLFTSAGAFDGMVTAGIKLEWIKDALRKTTLSNDALTAIADETGKIILTAKPTTLKKIEITSPFAKPDSLIDSTGVSWTYATAPLYDKMLYVVYAEPQSGLSTYARNQFRADVLIPILALLFTSVAVWLGVNRLVVRWLREMAELAKQFADGNYNGNPEKFINAPVEISNLSDDLHRMSAAISERNRDLEMALATTKKMAREVNHRVKNNLQMVTSLIALQSTQITDSGTRLALDQTRARIAALALIHRLLYDRTDEAEQGSIDFSIIMPELCAQLSSGATSYGEGLDLHCSADHVVGTVDQAIPLTLFIVEAVTNAFRHAFPDDHKGNVWVNLALNANQAILTISDDGVGFEKENAGSMGLTLMDAFVRQLNGTLNMTSAFGEGVAIKLVYDIARATD